MDVEELRRRMYGPKLRAVPDPLLAFPHYEDEYAPEKYLTVTSGQTYHFVISCKVSFSAEAGVAAVEFLGGGGGGGGA